MKTQWKVQINDGLVQDFETKTGLYGMASIAALAQLDYEEGTMINNNKVVNFVKIWAEDLLPDYGPYTYAFDGNTLYQAIKKGEDWLLISS